MSGGVGDKVIVAIGTTFDQSGIVAAKAGMRELAQLQTSTSAAAKAPAQAISRSSRASEGDQIFEQTRTANEKYEYQVRKLDDLHRKGAISSETYARARKQAVELLPKSEGASRETGAGGVGGIPSPSAALLAGAGSFVAAMQKAAVNAREIRVESQKLGTTVGFYRDLAWNANNAGTSLAEVASGMENVKAKAEAAASGDIAAKAFFAFGGISSDKINRGDTGLLARELVKGGAGLAAFGTKASADAVLQSSSGRPGFARAQNDALEAAGLMPEKAMAAINSGMGKFAMLLQAIGDQVGEKGLIGAFDRQGLRKSLRHQMQVAAEEDRQEAATRVANQNRANGTNAGVGLLSVRERLAQDAETERAFDYSAISAQTGVSKGTFRDRAATARDKEQFGFDSQFMPERERFARQQSLIADDEQNGMLKPTQAYRAQTQNMEANASNLSGARSNWENLQAQIEIGSRKFNDPAVTPSMQRDVARVTGDQLMNYADGLTQSGALAGAYGTNTVAGYSQQVSSEYSMDQSTNTLKMIDILTTIAINTGKMMPDEAKALHDNIGFRQTDIFGAGGH